MTETSFKTLKTQAEDVYKRYEAHFAGKPRATRDLELLDELIEELDGIIAAAENSMADGRDPAMVSLLDMAKRNRNNYREERLKVVDAKENGPTSERASRLATEANMEFGRYYRHFAGENRATRDTGLLTEIIVELERIESDMESLIDDEGESGLQSDLEVVRGNKETYRDEYRAIESAQQSGTPEEQVDLLAQLANNQFAIYSDHFAGKPRPTRRPGLLERVISQLKRIHKRMHGLQQDGLVSDANRRNMDTVSQKLDVYESELQSIRDARQSVDTRQLAGGLGSQANDIMADYREHFAGENRQTRDLDKLSLICDRIAEIAYQMRAIERDVEEPLEMNQKNLGIVHDSWSLYESEYRKVEQAQSDD